MPYFLILPAYAIFLVALIIIAIVARFTERFKSASQYIFAGAFGTLIGFLIANIFLWIIGLFPVWLNQNIPFPDWLQRIGKFFTAATLLLGPFIASAAGILLGLVFGVYFVHRRRRKLF